MISALSPKLNEKFIRRVRKELQVIQEIQFDEFPEVALVLDCSVQEIPRYMGTFNDMKVFYSNKHKKYCVKKEYGHLPNGQVCFISKFYPGSKHDFHVFLDNKEIYKTFLLKHDSVSDFWKLMADKGYEGAGDHIPCILPKRGTNFSTSEMRENIRISNSRIICENFYGRLKTL